MCLTAGTRKRIEKCEELKVLLGPASESERGTFQSEVYLARDKREFVIVLVREAEAAARNYNFTTVYHS